MSRVKIIYPTQNPIFTIQIPVRITDLNYGNHLGNDSVLSIVHEARASFLQSRDLSELNIGGCGLIMADAAVAYKNEGFFKDPLQVDLYAVEIGAMSFELLYKISTVRNEKQITIADVKTGMVCFDYGLRKVCAMPAQFRDILESKV